MPRTTASILDSSCFTAGNAVALSLQLKYAADHGLLTLLPSPLFHSVGTSWETQSNRLAEATVKYNLALLLSSSQVRMANSQSISVPNSP